LLHCIPPARAHVCRSDAFTPERYAGRASGES
jgi:hypothetical protein